MSRFGSRIVTLSARIAEQNRNRQFRDILELIPCNAQRPWEDKSVGNAALDTIFRMLGATRR